MSWLWSRQALFIILKKKLPGAGIATNHLQHSLALIADEFAVTQGIGTNARACFSSSIPFSAKRR